MSTITSPHFIESTLDPRMLSILDATSPTSLSVQEQWPGVETTNEAVPAKACAFPTTGSWKTRLALLKEVLPKQRDGTTSTYVIICYKHQPPWIERTSVAQLSQAWRALATYEVSRPIPLEEIIRRQADEFLAQLYQLDAAGDLQSATDKAFDYIDRLLSLGMFGVSNEILKRVQVERLSTSLMRSLLTITFAAKRHLQDREDFFEQVEKEMTSRRGPEVTTRLLSRLA